ncbi:uncharacterized protein LOC126334762 [Schistocerca gregaria]|uniref:uncharacterized protein LOC126334762 n=1 Tax=Schistocerca gregaria TaxID=7010 RepID=UPI00211EC822|nr:uncharacterized protein LOC126334762 [Schistocerca gregaria]
MSDSSVENNEFQFYLLLVRQCIFQLPEEDERVRAAAWMVHLRRLREASDLKLRNDYIKLLLFAMHSRCLIGPFSQPPQKDKGLEHFPLNFTFPDMMRRLIEESNAQSMRNCQFQHEDQSSLASGNCRLEVKVQENSEGNMSLPKMSLTQTQSCRRTFGDKITPADQNESFVAEPTASWVSGLTSASSKLSPDLKVENVIKLQNENRKECQSIIGDAAIKKEEGMKSTVDSYHELQHMHETGVSLCHSCRRISLNSTSSTYGGKVDHRQEICSSELHVKDQTPRNSNIEDEINVAHCTNENNRNNETHIPFKYSDNSHYQHSHHHHHHRPPVCCSNDQNKSALDMEITGRKYIGGMFLQMPTNGGMTTYAKQDSSVNCGHSCFSTDFSEARRKQQSSHCQLKENGHNNLRTNPLMLNFQTDYDRTRTHVSDRQVRENCMCFHSMSPKTGNMHRPLVFNRKSNAEYRSGAETEEQNIPSDEVMKKDNVKRSYIASVSGNGNDDNTTENSVQHKSVTYDSGSVHTRRIKDCSYMEDPKRTTEEQLFVASELELPFHVTDELGTNETSIRQGKSAQEMHLQGPSKQIYHSHTETQENTSSGRRHPYSAEDIPTNMIPKAKSSEFNVATFRASLSADLEAYSTGYAAGYSAGYAAGIAAALHSPPKHLYSVLH